MGYMGCNKGWNWGDGYIVHVSSITVGIAKHKRVVETKSGFYTNEIGYAPLLNGCGGEQPMGGAGAILGHRAQFNKCYSCKSLQGYLTVIVTYT